MSFIQLIFVLGCLFGATFCQAQEASDTTYIPFIAYWSKGDSYNFRITKLKQKWKEDQLTKNDSLSYVVNFEVLDSTADSYTIKWSYKSDFSQLGVEVDMQEELAGYFPNEIIYTTDAYGEFMEVVNWKEITVAMKKMSKEVIKNLSQEHKGDKQFQKMLKALLSKYQSQAGIENMLLQELYLFHFPLGYEYALEDTLSYEEEMTSNFGNSMVTGQAKIYLEEVDTQDYYAVLIKELQVNPEEMKKVMVEVYQGLGLEAGEFEAAMKEAVVENTEEHIFQYFYSPGIPYFIHSKREFYISVEGEEGGTITTTRIELLFDKD